MSDILVSPMLLTFCRAPVAKRNFIPPGVEMTGRGYTRVSTGPLIRPVDPLKYVNALPILWPQAPEDWGAANTLAVVFAAGGIIAESAPLPAGFAIRRGDQARIGAEQFLISGVNPETPRPYNVGRYSQSFYSVWPQEGAIFYALAAVGFEWARQGKPCAAWSPAPAIVVGGCA